MFHDRAVAWLGCVNGGGLLGRISHRRFALEARHVRIGKPSRAKGPRIPHHGLVRFLRLRSKARAFCLSVTGFVSPPIGQALADHALDRLLGAGFVVNA